MTQSYIQKYFFYFKFIFFIYRNINEIIIQLESIDYSNERYNDLISNLKRDGLLCLLNNELFYQNKELCEKIWLFCFYYEIDEYRKQCKKDKNNIIKVFY